MQIELIGCTSAGKSTLTRSILQSSHDKGPGILLGEDFVLEQFRLNWIKNYPLRKLLVNMAGLFASLLTWRNNREFYLFATQLLFQLPIPRLERFSLLRNVLKKIGIYEIIRFRSTDQQVILVDEGVLQAAHNLFVHVSVEVKTEELSTFATLIPLPDAVIYLRQPESLLIDRTMKRGHRRIPDGTYGKVVRFVKQAVATFDKLVQHPVVENRVLVVDGSRDVIMTAKYASEQDDPIMGLALKIVRSGFTSDTTDTVTEEIMYVE
jgi:hypothetical protein